MAAPEEISKLVERYTKNVKEASTPDAETRIQRQIEATDREIEGMVYELYGLTEEEVRIVEGEK